ncbi:hypothetical protein [Corynebacterium crudilactis]|uniref:Uncharacterized protein n=1 Tax=Corynebacterium crudilactis TaxID=1652495 RepID=A0A172QY12_9CORY|nr:hypothetical protein [Corynebacterium crudilactis]ANE05531.1 hypothetical protein ccrud_14415 [Corynebacterium crudilactis]
MAQQTLTPRERATLKAVHSLNHARQQEASANTAEEYAALEVSAAIAMAREAEIPWAIICQRIGGVQRNAAYKRFKKHSGHVPTTDSDTALAYLSNMWANEQRAQREAQHARAAVPSGIALCRQLHVPWPTILPQLGETTRQSAINRLATWLTHTPHLHDPDRIPWVTHPHWPNAPKLGAFTTHAIAMPGGGTLPWITTSQLLQLSETTQAWIAHPDVLIAVADYITDIADSTRITAILDAGDPLDPDMIHTRVADTVRMGGHTVITALENVATTHPGTSVSAVAAIIEELT